MRSAALMAIQPDSRPSAPGRERNAQLLVELLRDKEHLLRRQARRHAQLPDDVDDALQSAYLRFVERYNGVGEPLAWLYTTLKRVAWAMRRRTSRDRECSPTVPIESGNGVFDLAELMPTDLPGPDERVQRDERVAERIRSLSELKPDERRALALLAFGLSYEEICETTGWSHTKVNRCVSEGRAALRRTDRG